MSCPSRTPLEEEVLEHIRPTRAQVAVLSRFYEAIRGALGSCIAGVEFRVEPVGSFAKGTLLRDKWEIDVFVLYRGVGDEWVTSEGARLIRECLGRRFPTVEKYSQHPYVTVKLMGLEADVVPALWLEKPRPRGLGVERTPFHTRYVLSRLTPCLREDVMLLKSLLKGVGVYGAETRIRGFSGYLAELLVIAHGGFRPLLEAASQWRPPVYVDPEGLGYRARLESRYPDSPIIVVDPVDPERNAAAAVSLESLATFILAARAYLEHPTRSFYHVFPPESSPPPPPRAALLRVECRGDYTAEPPENLWGKARRLAESLASQLRHAGFKPAMASFETDEATRVEITVLLESGELPEYEYVEGPEAWGPRERVLSFARARLARGEHVWVAPSGRLAGLRKRRWRRADDLARDWLPIAEKALAARDCQASLEDCGVNGACEPTPGWLVDALGSAQ